MDKTERLCEIRERYGLTLEEAEIAYERQKVYGDPWINHLGIAQGWAGILQPWSLRIAQMEPLPPHVIALLMATLKTNRMRMIFHEDNYDDASVYLNFARTWQRECSDEGIVIPPKPGPDYQLEIRWIKKDLSNPEDLEALNNG